MSVVFFLGQLGEKHKIQRGQAQVIKQEWDKKKKTSAGAKSRTFLWRHVRKRTEARTLREKEVL